MNLTKLFTALLAISLVNSLMVVNPVLAANTATELYTVGNRVHGEGPEIYVGVAIDTTGADLTLRDPAAGKSVCVTGLVFSEATAANITLKSGSETMVVLEVPANHGVVQLVQPLCTEADQNLVMQSSAAISSMLFTVVDSGQLVRH